MFDFVLLELAATLELNSAQRTFPENLVMRSSHVTRHPRPLHHLRTEVTFQQFQFLCSCFGPVLVHFRHVPIQIHETTTTNWTRTAPNVVFYPVLPQSSVMWELLPTDLTNVALRNIVHPVHVPFQVWTILKLLRTKRTLHHRQMTRFMASVVVLQKFVWQKRFIANRTFETFWVLVVLHVVVGAFVNVEL